MKKRRIEKKKNWEMVSLFLLFILMHSLFFVAQAKAEMLEEKVPLIEDPVSEKATDTITSIVLASEKAVIISEKATITTGTAMTISEKATATIDPVMFVSEKATTATKPVALIPEKATVTIDPVMLVSEKATITTGTAMTISEKATATETEKILRKKMLAEKLAKKVTIEYGERLENAPEVVLLALTKITELFPKETIEIFSIRRKPRGGSRSLHHSKDEELGAIDFVFSDKTVKKTQKLLTGNLRSPFNKNGMKIVEFFGPREELNTWTSNGSVIARQHWNHIHLGVELINKEVK